MTIQGMTTIEQATLVRVLENEYISKEYELSCASTQTILE
jgi:hypothetical protein